MSKYQYTPDKISQLAANEIFVFGSNLQGMHGGGAARYAHQHFGAVWGKGVGLYGQSYAIPTMHGGPDAIKPYVDEFISFAKQTKESEAKSGYHRSFAVQSSGKGGAAFCGPLASNHATTSAHKTKCT